MEEAEATDLMLHEAVIDHLSNEIISNAYRVNWIKIKLIRLAETRLYVTMIPQVMGEHIEDHRGHRAPRRGRGGARDGRTYRRCQTAGGEYLKSVKCHDREEYHHDQIDETRLSGRTAPLSSGITSLPKEEEQLLVNVTLTHKT